MEHFHVELHEYNAGLEFAWQQIKKTQEVFKLDIIPPTCAVDTNKVRFVCMSDTHSETHKIKFEVPEGDVFIHAGDFTMCGDIKEVIDFNRWLETLPHKHKVVIAGDHDLTFDKRLDEDWAVFNQMDSEVVRQHLQNCIYLEDESIEIYGIKIYGSPWLPTFHGGAFSVTRGEESLSKWNKIPENVDILITHSPPIGHGDLVRSGGAGCVDLLATVQKRVKPKYHVFGHIHKGYGITTDGNTIYINASNCIVKDHEYIPKNFPIVFDMPVPMGFDKTNDSIVKICHMLSSCTINV